MGLFRLQWVLDQSGPLEIRGSIQLDPLPGSSRLPMAVSCFRMESSELGGSIHLVVRFVVVVWSEFNYLCSMPWSGMILKLCFIEFVGPSKHFVWIFLPLLHVKADMMSSRLFLVKVYEQDSIVKPGTWFEARNSWRSRLVKNPPSLRKTRNT